MALLREIISDEAMSKVVEDQGSNDFITQNEDVLIHVSGYYTIAELETKLRELNEAQRLFSEHIS